MTERDVMILRQMEQEIIRSCEVDLGTLSQKLLGLRDHLHLVDPDWYHRLTQSIATLDSASTFPPKSEMENQQVKAAIKEAVSQIRELISAKLL